MEINETIKILREKQGVSQTKLAKGIMERSCYSRFELGQRAITAEEYTQIMNRLRAHATDLNDIENLENAEISMIREKHKAAFNDDLPKKELENLYFMLKKRYNESPQLYRAYLFTKQYFNTYSDLIPEISLEEKNDLFNQLQTFKYWPNFYIKMIMDFTVLFTPEQLIYLLDRLETYRVEWISPIDCQYLHVLPGAISNIADSLIDHAVLDTESVNKEFFPHVEKACQKLTEIIELRPSFDYSLLLKLHHIRLEYFSAETKESKETALKKAEQFLQETIFINLMKDYHGKEVETAAKIVQKSLTNLIKLGRPGTEINYFTI
ncbi:helix-turn-helix domain-containing protein [Enterococcus thailandicus]|uniref:helix-turn-helix domain-containing protein n=1 Tax=Enterococcus thailandicus TaxID=417368 RepID=UPI0035D8132B